MSSIPFDVQEPKKIAELCRNCGKDVAEEMFRKKIQHDDGVLEFECEACDERAALQDDTQTDVVEEEKAVAEVESRLKAKEEKPKPVKSASGFEIHTAERKRTHLKMGVRGPSGSGKSKTSLMIAKGLVGDLADVVVIDTENESANLYDYLGPYRVIPFRPPYTPERYVEAIGFAVTQGAKLVIVDSASHEWEGAGGLLEIQGKLGGRYQDWLKANPLHKKFVDAILQAPCHVICTIRTKQDYVLEEYEDGGRKKTRPVKIGMKEVQREGFEFDLTTNIDMDMEHTGLAAKDRTGLFSSITRFDVGEFTGVQIREWLESGAPEAPLSEEEEQERQQFIEATKAKKETKQTEGAEKDELVLWLWKKFKAVHKGNDAIAAALFAVTQQIFFTGDDTNAGYRSFKEMPVADLLNLKILIDKGKVSIAEGKVIA